MKRRICGVLAVVLASIGGGADAADATPPLSQRLVYLAPNTGITWRATNQFQVTWIVAAGEGTVAPTGFAYRVNDASGHPLGPPTRIGVGERMVQVAIPSPGSERVLPGIYQFELWFESPAGDGPHETTALLFDDTRPAAVAATGPSGWIRAGTEAEIRIEHPAAPRPPSGILGYAIEIDHGSGSGPCGGRDLCSANEVALDGGEGDDLARVGPLAEGTNLVRVVSVSGTGVSSKPSPGVGLRVDGTPPEVVLSGVPAGWSAGPVEVTAQALDALSGMEPGGSGGAVTAIALDDEVATVAPGPVARAVVRGQGVHEVGAYARDAVGNLSPGGESSKPPRLGLVRIDETAPSVAFAPRQDPAGPERIVARVDDALAGPSEDRGVIAVRPPGGTAPFEPMPTTVAAGKLTARWDSDSYPLGRYEFRATGYDRAGNRKVTELRSDGRAFTLDNPVKTPTTISLGFGGRQLVWHRCDRVDGALRCHRRLIGPFEQRPTTRSAAYGRSVPISGRLITPFGPAANQRVEIVETFAAGAESRERRTTLLTDARGEFLAHLPAGPSRQVEVRFDGSPTLTRTGTGTLRLRVRTAVRLRSSAATAAIGGAPVVFSGIVAHEGAPIPATGLPVALQFRLPGVPWTEFRTVQTGPGGRFRFPYSFSDDDSRGVRFQFRAHLAAQAGWPFDPGNSRPVMVTGR